MHNYEELYAVLQPLEKALKDSAAAVTKYQKAIQKNTDSGNLAEVKKKVTAERGWRARLSDRFRDALY